MRNDGDPVVQIEWTQPMLNELERLWATGMSTRYIAISMAKTFNEPLFNKNRIVGAKNRLGLKSRLSPIVGFVPKHKAKAHVPVRPTLPPLVSAPMPTQAAVALPPTAATMFDEPGFDEEDAAPLVEMPTKPLPVSIVPLRREAVPVSRDRTCEWLEGDTPRTFVRCTEPSLMGKSWCACHYDVVFKPGRQRIAA